MSPSDKRAVGLLTLLVLLTFLPFVNRAYFVDDFYFVTIAKGILQNPLRPYDFKSDDAGIGNVGWERGQRPRMVNPLLFHYYLAAVIKLAGDATWKLRAATIVFSLISVWCMYFLGKRFVPHPLAAASLFAITPAYWLTSYSLLIDSGLVAFFLASLLCFFIGHERRRLGWILTAGLLMGLTILVKYFGALIVPLALLWQLSDEKRLRWWASYSAYLVCGAVLLGWGLWNIATYGQMHILAALPRGFHSTSAAGLAALTLFILVFLIPSGESILRKRIPVSYVLWGGFSILLTWGLAHAASFPGWLEAFYVDKILVLGSFIGGTTIFLFFVLPVLARKRTAAFIMLGIVVVLLYFGFCSSYGGFDRLQSAMLSLFIAATAGFLLLINLSLPAAPSVEHRFLLAWILLGILELITVMPWTAGRYLLLILPPLCWSFSLIIDEFSSPRVWRLAWMTTFLAGCGLAYADYAQANTIKELAAVLSTKSQDLQRLSDHSKHHWYYLADTFDGSQPYIMPLGWENVFPYQTFHSGDLFLKSYYRKSSWWKMDHPERFRLIMTYEIRSSNPLRVMDVPASAGFYASCWGALPFAISRHPLERFELYQVK